MNKTVFKLAFSLTNFSYTVLVDITGFCQTDQMLDSASEAITMLQTASDATHMPPVSRGIKDSTALYAGSETDCGFGNRVSSELKKYVTFPWVPVSQEDGVIVLLLSRDCEQSVQRRVFFSFDGTVQISVHRKPITGLLLENVLLCNNELCEPDSEGKPRWRMFVERIIGVLKRLKSYEVCIGVNEAKYKPLWEIDKLGEVDKNPYGELRYITTFRPFACHILVPTITYLKRRCVVCIQTKIRLRVKMQRHASSMALQCTPNVHLDRNQLITKVIQQKKSLKDSHAQISKLKSHLQRALSANSCELDHAVSEEIMKIVMAYTTCDM